MIPLSIAAFLSVGSRFTVALAAVGYDGSGGRCIILKLAISSKLVFLVFDHFPNEPIASLFLFSFDSVLGILLISLPGFVIIFVV